MDEPEANQSIRLLRDEARDLGVALRVVAVEEREHDGPVDTGRAGAARADEQGGFSITVPRSGPYLLGVRVPGFADFRTAVTVSLPNGQLLDLTTGSAAMN